MAGLISEEAT